jgi:hypothetical protein
MQGLRGEAEDLTCAVVGFAHASGPVLRRCPDKGTTRR